MENNGSGKDWLVNWNENEILFPKILLFLKQTFEISRRISYLEIEASFVIDNMIVWLNWYSQAPL